MQWTKGQKEAIEGLTKWFNEGNDQVRTVLGYAGCLGKDELILTDDGLVSIENIFDSNKNTNKSRGFTKYNGGYRVFTKDGDIKDIDKLYVTDKMKGYNLKLQSGNSIKVSEEHKFLVMDPNKLAYSWMKIKDIPKGYQIALSSSMDQILMKMEILKSTLDNKINLHFLTLRKFVMSEKETLKEIKEMIKKSGLTIRELEIILLGLLSTTFSARPSGNIKTHNTTNHLIVKAILENIFEAQKFTINSSIFYKLFDIDNYTDAETFVSNVLVNQSTNISTNNYTLSFTPDDIKDNLVEMVKEVVSGGTMYDQYLYVQSLLFQIDYNAGYLDPSKSYRLDIDLGRIHIPELSKYILNVLNSFGIKVELDSIKKKHPLIVVDPINVKKNKVYKYFTFPNNGKSSIYKYLNSNISKELLNIENIEPNLITSKGNDTIYDIIGERLGISYINSEIKNIYGTTNHVLEGKVLGSPETLKYLVIHNYNKLYDLWDAVNNDYFFDVIVEKEEIEEVFYDIEVPDGHNYISNGIISHNSGKTTVVRELIDRLGLQDSQVITVTFTAKAAFRLMLDGVQADTIHSVLYEPEVVKTYHDKKTGKIVSSNRVMKDDEDPMNVVDRGSNDKIDESKLEVRVKLKWKRRETPPEGIKLIIIDEVSMVTDKIFNDLLALGIPIINIGDNFQLAPVGGKPIPHMENPDYFLDEIVRQAEGDPIIHLSMLIREGKNIEVGKYRNQNNGKITTMVVPPGYNRNVNLTRASQVIVSRNATRHKLNSRIRAQLFGVHEDELPLLPLKGDKIICLQNNRGVRTESKFPMTNGMIGHVMDDIIHLDTDRDVFKINFSEVYQGELPGELDMEVPKTELDVSLSGFLINSGIVKTHKDLHPKMKKREARKFINGNKDELLFEKPESVYGLDYLDKEINYSKSKDFIQFDYGYSITNHKAQGSQFPTVYGIEERIARSDYEHRRGLYTMVTRAESALALELQADKRYW